MRSSRKHYFLCLLLLVSFFLAFGLNWVIRNAPVDIGLDLLEEPISTPLVRWGIDPESCRLMERIPAQLSLGKGFFQLTARTRKNPQTGKPLPTRFVIRDMVNFEGDLEYLPEEKWVWKEESLVAFPGKDYAMLRWEGFRPPFYLTFSRGSRAPDLEITTIQGQETVQLSQAGGKYDTPIPVDPLPRYSARVPRKALGHLVLELPGNPTLLRLFIGTWIPTSFFTLDSIPSSAKGRIFKNWQPLVEQESLRVFSGFYLDRGGVVTFCLLLLMVILFLSGLVLAGWLVIQLFRWYRSEPATRRKLTKFKPLPFILFLLPLLLTGLFWLASFYPGAMSPDSLDQWEQVHSLNFRKAHPIFHTLTLKLITEVWDSPAAVALIQILLMSMALAYGYTLLLRAGVPRIPVIIALICSALSVRNGNMSIVLWKDVFYGIVVFFLTIWLVRCLLDRETGNRIRTWIYIGLLTLLAPLYRYNGLLIYIGILPALPFVFWSQWKKTFWAIGVALILLIGFQFGVLPFLNIEKGVSFSFDALRVDDLCKQDIALSPVECELLDQVGIYGRPFRWGNLDFGPKEGDTDQAFKRLHRDLLLRYPVMMSKYQLGGASYLYWPVPPKRELMLCGHNTIEANRFGLMQNPILPWGNQLLKAVTRLSLHRSLIWIFWRPGLHLWLVLIALGVLLWRVRDYRFLIVFLPVFLNTLSLFIAPGAANQRYQFPLTLATGFLVCLALLPKDQTVPAELPVKKETEQEPVSADSV